MSSGRAVVTARRVAAAAAAALTFAPTAVPASAPVTPPAAAAPGPVAVVAVEPASSGAVALSPAVPSAPGVVAPVRTPVVELRATGAGPASGAVPPLGTATGSPPNDNSEIGGIAADNLPQDGPPTTGRAVPGSLPRTGDGVLALVALSVLLTVAGAAARVVAGGPRRPARP